MKLKLQNVNPKNKRKNRSNGNEVKEARSKRILTFLFFVLLSFVFWLLMSLRLDYRMRVTLPVVYDELPANVRHADTAPEEVVFEIEDKGVELLKYSLKKFAPIRVKLSAQNRQHLRLELGKKALVEELQRQLSPGTRIISATPSEISLPLFTLRDKLVPVKLGFKPALTQGHRLGATIITPSAVHIYGSDQKLRHIKEVLTDSVDLSQYTSLTELDVPLKEPGGGVEYDKNPQMVHITFDIEALTERSYDLPIQAHNIPSGYTLILLPGTAKVTLTIPQARYNQLDPEQLELAIVYPKGGAKISDTQLPVELRNAPDWIVSYRCHPSKVEFILKKSKSE